MRKFFVVAIGLIMATGVYAQRGTCGTGVAWSLTDGTLTITGSGAMNDFSTGSSARPSWDVYKDEITDVVVTSGVTHVGNCAFYDFSGIRTVALHEGVESVGTSAFENCSGVGQIVFPGSLREIASGAFSGTGLTALTIPEGIESIGRSAFSRCGNLTTLIWNAVNCSYSGTCSLFSDGRFDMIGGAVTEVRFGEKVQAVPEMLFNSCTRLTDVITSGSISQVGNNAFYGTQWLNSQPEGLVLVDKALYAYQGVMTKATTIEIPEGVESITDYAFNSCTYLVGISVPTTMKMIGENVFYGCRSLGRIVWNAVNCNGVESGPFSNAAIYEVEFGDKVQSIPGYMFYDCDGIEELIFPASLISIGEYAFSRCDAIKELEFPASLRSIGIGAFSNCEALNRVVVSENVLSIDGLAFSENDNLKQVVFNAIDCRYMGGLSRFIPFLYTNIESFVFGDKVTYIPENICSGQHELTSVVIPPSVREIGEEAFSSCSKITSLAIGEGVEIIGKRAFAYCTGVESLYIPGTVKKIGSLAFENNERLKEVIVASDEIAEVDRPFSGCAELTSIWVPDAEVYKADQGWRGDYNAIKPMVSFAQSSFVYSGMVPEVEYSNNLSGYTLQLEQPDMGTNAGSYAVTLAANFTGEHSFSVHIPYAYVVEKAAQQIIWEQEFPVLHVGDKVQLSATSTSELPVDFETDDTDVCSIECINGDYVLTCLATGMVRVRAVQAGDDNREAAREVERQLVIQASTGFSDNVVNNLVLYVKGEELVVRGSESGVPVCVYTLDGALLHTQMSNGCELRFRITDSGVYIVRLGTKAYKMIIGK